MNFWNSTTEAVVTIFMGIVAVAILAVIVSQKSNTAGVIQAAGSAFSNGLAVAESPVTGASVNIDTSYPGSNGASQAGLYGTGMGVAGY